MRAKLERIAAGKIEFDKPAVTLSDSIITVSCKSGEKVEGSFTLSADRPVKGIVYVSSSRMSVEHPSFHSRTARISYTFDARGFWGGEETEGEFCIVTEAGEFLIPYTVRVEAQSKPVEESYAYFVSADPIAPLPEEPKDEEVQTVVEVTGEAGEELSPEEAGKLAEQILRGLRPAALGFARLKDAYHRNGNKEMLAAVCSVLIKNGRTDADSFFWYKRGVQSELKITNLYEYFMQAVPEDYAEALPKNLLLYFQMENSLSSAQKAFLYANIIRYQEPDSTLYHSYKPQIEAFMLEELLKRRQSENLAVIYERFLVEDLLTIDFAEALADIMFLRKLTCADRRIRQVQVLYEQLQRRICVPLVGGQALIPVYTPGAVILMVDEQGNCYTSSVPYTLKRLMNEQKYVKRCRELLRYHQGLYLYLCDGMSRYHVITAENVENYKRVLKTGLTADRFAEYFAEFCARSYRDERFEFTEVQFEKYFNELRERQKGLEEVTASDFRDDLVGNMCLMFYESGKYHFTHRSFQEYFCALYFSKQKDRTLGHIGDFFENKKSRHYTDKTFNMLYDMIPEKIEEYIFEPFLTSLFRECDEQEGYWTFLQRMYPVLYYEDGETSGYSINEPDSFLYDFIAHNVLACHTFGNEDLPQDERFVVNEWVYLDEAFEDPDYDTNELIELKEVPWEYKREYGDPEIVGTNYEIQISNLLNDPESFDDVVSLLENDEFPLKAEFVKVREYMQKLIDEKETVGDDLFDMFL